MGETYIGKETNKLEDAEVGLTHDLSKVLEVYGEFRRDSWERLVQPVLKEIPASKLQERTGLSRRSIQRLRNGHSRPTRDHEAALTAAAANFARRRLEEAGQEAPRQELLSLQAYLRFRQEGDGRIC
jgi:hypothetical protein